jgi:hypothetical protein
MMFGTDETESRSTIGDIVPGYAYYSGIGYGLAEAMVNLVEWMLARRT